MRCKHCSYFHQDMFWQCSTTLPAAGAASSHHPNPWVAHGVPVGKAGGSSRTLIINLTINLTKLLVLRCQSPSSTAYR